MTPARLLALCTARVFLFSTFMTVAAVIPLLMRDWALSAHSSVRSGMVAATVMKVANKNTRALQIASRRPGVIVAFFPPFKL